MAGTQRTTPDPVVGTSPSPTASDDVVGRGSHAPAGTTLAGTSEGASLSEDQAERAHEDLLRYGQYYDFFYVVGMVERLTPGAIRVGGDGPIDREGIRFGHDPSLGFSPGDVKAVQWCEIPRAPEDGLSRRRHRYHVTTSFLGLTGAATPMPLFMAEELLQAQDQAGLRRDFLDLFHHRLLSLVYRLGTKFEFSREFSREGADPWTRRILALGGIDAPIRPQFRHVPAWRLARLAPLLANRVRSGRMIEIAITDVCSDALGTATVRIEQFAGGWVALDSGQRMLLQTRNSVLGRSSVLGVQCLDRSSRAIIVIGPLHENFRRFMADGDMFPALAELLRFLCPEPIEFELELVLAQDARPPFLLGATGGQRVGLDTWLSSRMGATSQTHLRVPVPLYQDSDLPS